MPFCLPLSSPALSSSLTLASSFPGRPLGRRTPCVAMAGQRRRTIPPSSRTPVAHAPPNADSCHRWRARYGHDLGFDRSPVVCGAGKGKGPRHRTQPYPPAPGRRPEGPTALQATSDDGNETYDAPSFQIKVRKPFSTSLRPHRGSTPGSPLARRPCPNPLFPPSSLPCDALLPPMRRGVVPCLPLCVCSCDL